MQDSDNNGDARKEWKNYAIDMPMESIFIAMTMVFNIWKMRNMSKFFTLWYLPSWNMSIR